MFLSKYSISLGQTKIHTCLISLLVSFFDFLGENTMFSYCKKSKKLVAQTCTFTLHLGMNYGGIVTIKTTCAITQWFGCNPIPSKLDLGKNVQWHKTKLSISVRPFIFHTNKKILLQAIFVEQFNQSFDQNLFNNTCDLKMSKDNMF